MSSKAKYQKWDDEAIAGARARAKALYEGSIKGNADAHALCDEIEWLQKINDNCVRVIKKQEQEITRLKKLKKGEAEK